MMLVGLLFIFLLEVSLSRVGATDVVLERQDDGCDSESECKKVYGKCYSRDSVPGDCVEVPTCVGGGPDNMCVCCLQAMDRQFIEPDCTSNGGTCKDECMDGDVQIPKSCPFSDPIYDPDNEPKCCVKLCQMFEGNCIKKDEQCVDPDFHLLPCGCREGEGCCIHKDKLDEAKNYMELNGIDCD